MRAFLVLAALVLMPSSLFAEPFDYETLTFSHQFTIEIHAGFPAFPEHFGIVAPHYLPQVFVEWDVPPFDHRLGIVEGFQLEWNYTVDQTVTSDPPGVVGPAIVVLLSNPGGYQNPFASLPYPPDSPPIHWVIEIHPDSHATYDVSYAATFDIVIDGPATATYFYRSAAEVPEPSTLVLLGSGVIGAALKRRRRH